MNNARIPKIIPGKTKTKDAGSLRSFEIVVEVSVGGALAGPQSSLANVTRRRIVIHSQLWLKCLCKPFSLCRHSLGRHSNLSILFFRFPSHRPAE
jgi:hypothetical protein